MSHDEGRRRASLTPQEMMDLFEQGIIKERLLDIHGNIRKGIIVKRPIAERSEREDFEVSAQPKEGQDSRRGSAAIPDPTEGRQGLDTSSNYDRKHAEELRNHLDNHSRSPSDRCRFCVTAEEPKPEAKKGKEGNKRD